MTPLARFLDEAEARCAKATDHDQTIINHYDNGGGRLYIPCYPDGTGRTLVADFYDEGNRDFYYHARSDLPAALSLLRAFAAVVEEARDYLKGEHEAQALLEVTFGAPEEEHLEPEELSSWKLLQSVKAADAAVAALEAGKESE